MISTQINTFGEWSFLEKWELVGEDNHFWKQGLGSRGLLIAQAIISIVAIPLILLAMIFGIPLVYCVESRGNAWALLENLTGKAITHVMLIPVSIVAALFCGCASDRREETQARTV